MEIQGHLSGGLLAAEVLLLAMKPASARERLEDLAWGSFCGFLPDLDYFIYAVHKRGIKYGSDFRHHTWVTHTFLFYWLPSLALWAFGRLRKNRTIQRKAAILAAGTTAHLLQDTIGSGDGIMLFYPFSRDMQGIKLSGLHGAEWKKDYELKPVYKVEQAITAMAVVCLVFEVLHRLKK